MALRDQKPRLTRFYILADPFMGLPRYVGKTWNTLKFRLRRHLREREETQTHKNNWVCSVVSRGEKPQIKLIAEHVCVDWQLFEKHYVKLFKSFGAHLVNGTDGGDGCHGHTQEVKEKISKANKGKRKFFSKEHRKKISESLKGRKLSEEHRRNISKSQSRKPLSDEHRRKISKTKMGKGHSSETRLKMSKLWSEASPSCRRRRMRKFCRRLQELVEVKDGIA